MNIRKLAAVGATALLLMGLAASPPAHAGIFVNGFMMNGLKFNGLRMNGLKFNGPDQPFVGQGGGGVNFNALKLHAVVLPTDVQ